MPNKKPCFLVSSSERSEENKASCLSTSVPVFLLSPQLSGLVFVKYPDWIQGGRKFIAGLQLCPKPHQKI